MRFLFPESFADSGKNFPAAQFRRVLEHRRGGLVVQNRPVAEDDQRGVMEIFNLHATKLAQACANFKPRPAANFY